MSRHYDPGKNTSLRPTTHIFINPLEYVNQILSNYYVDSTGSHYIFQA